MQHLTHGKTVERGEAVKRDGKWPEKDTLSTPTTFASISDGTQLSIMGWTTM